MNKSVFINIGMGLGGNISFTGAAMKAKEKGYCNYIAVCSPYFDIFQSCPYVDAVYKPSEIRDFIFDARDMGAEIINHRIYDMSSFIYKDISYETAWLKLLGIENDNDEGKGSNCPSQLDNCLKVFPALNNNVNDFLKALKEHNFDNFIIAQFSGGQTPLVNVPVVDGKQDWTKVPYNYDNEPLKRHYPKEMANEFVDLFTKEHPKTAILMYQLPNEPFPSSPNVIRMTVPYLAYYELAKNELCLGTVSIDSSLQHLVAGHCKSLVIWGHSLPTSFGYAFNRNIIQQCRRDDILYFTALGASGAKIQYIEPKELLREVDEYIFKVDEQC